MFYSYIKLLSNCNNPNDIQKCSCLHPHSDINWSLKTLRWHKSNDIVLGELLHLCWFPTASWLVAFPYCLLLENFMFVWTQMFVGQTFKTTSSGSISSISRAEKPGELMWMFIFLLPVRATRWVLFIGEIHGTLDWFKGKSTGNHGFYHQI